MKQPVPDFATTEWITLSEKLIGDPESEYSNDDGVFNVRNPSMGVFRSRLGPEPRAAVVICPGGGYEMLCVAKEGYEIASWMNSLGIDAYVLKYRMKQFGYPAPLQDATLAVRYLRHNAAALGIDPDNIGMMGFSAGGHVAGMAATLYDSSDTLTGSTLDEVSARPDFCILAYPVLTMLDPLAHAGSRINLIGNDADKELIEALSLENRVTPETPPVFLFHTATDPTVPMENSLRFAEALKRNKCEVALHVFATGPHGTGMRPGYGITSNWPVLLAAWLKERGLVSE